MNQSIVNASAVLGTVLAGAQIANNETPQVEIEVINPQTLSSVHQSNKPAHSPTLRPRKKPTEKFSYPEGNLSSMHVNLHDREANSWASKIRLTCEVNLMHPDEFKNKRLRKVTITTRSTSINVNNLLEIDGTKWSSPNFWTINKRCKKYSKSLKTVYESQWKPL